MKLHQQCLKEIADNKLEEQAAARNDVLSKHLRMEDGSEQQQTFKKASSKTFK